jgi:hypothetical protein
MVLNQMPYKGTFSNSAFAIKLKSSKTKALVIVAISIYEV